MSQLYFLRCLSNSLYLTCSNRNVVAKLIAPISLQFVLVQTRGKHWNPKFKEERAKKVLKVELPDYDEQRKENTRSLDEMKAKLKEKGILPFRPYNEKPMFISCLGTLMDAYVPPEGDAKVSVVSSLGMKQAYDSIGKKGKSYLALRKIRKFDYEFDVPTIAEKVKNIYIESQTALANKKDNLYEFVTENALPDMLENTKNKIIKWNYVQSLEPPRIVHIRCQDMVQSENMFAQITLRLFSQQTLAVYDRFGRLMYGSEDTLKDVLEYIVFEKHITNPNGLWRVQGKIVPDWLPPKEPIEKTISVPHIATQSIKPAGNEINISEASPSESR